MRDGGSSEEYTLKRKQEKGQTLKEVSGNGEKYTPKRKKETAQTLEKDQFEKRTNLSSG